MLVASALVKHYGSAKALRGVSISIEVGDVTVVMGPSGSGKSTLIRALSLVEPPDEGAISIDNRPLFPASDRSTVQHYRPWPEITVVFQQLFLWPHKTLRENIELPALLRGKPLDRVDSLLKELSITPIVSRYPNEVSVGQRQRAALARAVLLQPKYLLLDEITSALDVEQIRKLVPVLLGLLNQGTGLLVVTHHYGFARKLLSSGKRGIFVFLENGIVAEAGDRTYIDNPNSPRLKEFLFINDPAG